MFLVGILVDLTSTLYIDLIAEFLPVKSITDDGLDNTDFGLVLILPFGILGQVLENVASNVDILRIKHVNMRIGDGIALIVGDHAALGEQLQSLGPLQRANKGTLGRFFVIVKVVFGKIDHIEMLVILLVLLDLLDPFKLSTYSHSSSCFPLRINRWRWKMLLLKRLLNRSINPIGLYVGNHGLSHL
jgi:hypothetical protein